MRRALLDGGRWCALVARLFCGCCRFAAWAAVADDGLWGVVISRPRRLPDGESERAGTLANGACGNAM